MTVSPFDSALYGRAYADPEIARLFSDSADIRSMLLVWGALAKVQADRNLIPRDAAMAIDRAAMEIWIDPAGLADATVANGVCVPGLLTAFRSGMQAPREAAFIHYGATSQDIIDTALALRLRQALTLLETRLNVGIETLADLAEQHAETPMAARTWGQVATPTTFGAAVAIWGTGPPDASERIAEHPVTGRSGHPSWGSGNPRRDGTRRAFHSS